jgi:hypothetical protein
MYLREQRTARNRLRARSTGCLKNKAGTTKETTDEEQAYIPFDWLVDCLAPHWWQFGFQCFLGHCFSTSGKTDGC